ncbi:hypothetical protein V6N13_091330 [Hibiscus sabdariffa]
MIDSSLASCEVYNPSAIILSSRSKEEDDEFGPLVATTSANFTAGQDVGIMTALLIGLVDRKSGGLGQSSSIWSSNCAKVVTEPSRSLEHMFKKLVKAQLQVRVLKEGGKDDIEVISTANLRVTVAKNEVEVTCTEVLSLEDIYTLEDGVDGSTNKPSREHILDAMVPIGVIGFVSNLIEEHNHATMTIPNEHFENPHTVKL